MKVVIFRIFQQLVAFFAIYCTIYFNQLLISQFHLIPRSLSDIQIKIFAFQFDIFLIKVPFLPIQAAIQLRAKNQKNQKKNRIEVFPDIFNERTNKRTNKQTYKQTNKRTNKRTNERTNKPTNVQTNQQTNQQTNKQTYKRTNKQTNKQTYSISSLEQAALQQRKLCQERLVLFVFRTKNYFFALAFPR